MNWRMALVLCVVVPVLLAVWAHEKYGDPLDTIGAALVGAILMGTSVAAALIVSRRR
jgi:hypothetical protein